MMMIHSCGAAYIAHQLRLDSGDLQLGQVSSTVEAIAAIELHNPVNHETEIFDEMTQGKG